MSLKIFLFYNVRTIRISNNNFSCRVSKRKHLAVSLWYRLFSSGLFASWLSPILHWRVFWRKTQRLHRCLWRSISYPGVHIRLPRDWRQGTCTVLRKWTGNFRVWKCSCRWNIISVPRVLYNHIELSKLKKQTYSLMLSFSIWSL